MADSGGEELHRTCGRCRGGVHLRGLEKCYHETADAAERECGAESTRGISRSGSSTMLEVAGDGYTDRIMVTNYNLSL